METFQPELLFIESAWLGKDDLWYRKVSNVSKELFELTRYCKYKKIPTVFWNKEDPVYFNTFLQVAKLVDFIFTTDMDSIAKYKRELCHERVYHLHFAAQPMIHNPIEKEQRKEKFCFAGAYYHKYSNRSKVFDEFASDILLKEGLDIYDRNYGQEKSEYEFPEQYKKHIIGYLDPLDMKKAYSSYEYGINMNSVTQSQTMFSRRVFEMLASNMIAVGNYSRGVKNYFGDLTISTDDVNTLQQYQSMYCSNELLRHKYRLLGLRKVLKEHLYEDRLAYIVKMVFGIELTWQLPTITVIAKAENTMELDQIIGNYERQNYTQKQLRIIADLEQEKEDRSTSSIQILSAKEVAKSRINDIYSSQYLAVFHPKDYYGVNYLMDLALNTRHGEYLGIGKDSFYENMNGKIIRQAGLIYRIVNQLGVCRSIVTRQLMEGKTVEEGLQMEIVESGNLLAGDEFGYCKNNQETLCPEVEDLAISDEGIALDRILEIAQSEPQAKEEAIFKVLTSEEIVRQLKNMKINKILYEQASNTCILRSTLGPEEVQYIYLPEFYKVNDAIHDGKINIRFRYTGDIRVIGYCIFFDKSNARISSTYTKGSNILSTEVPEGTLTFRLALRCSGPGTTLLENIEIGVQLGANEDHRIITRSNVLIVSNNYPEKDNLYRSMFVHKRVLEYKRLGLVCDVMRMSPSSELDYSEFEGINITQEKEQQLQKILKTGEINTVCIHFLDETIWKIIKPYLGKLNIIVWIHGSDIQPWYRRKYIYDTAEKVSNGVLLTEKKKKLWNDVFAKENRAKLHFVVVSKYFKQMIEEDYTIVLEESECSVIPNFIDTSLFSYQKKEIEQRKKIVSVRPYASSVYANDLMAKAITLLANWEKFSELSFTIIGDGILFEQITEPLKKYPNVTLQKTFLRQFDLAKLYCENGIVLIPTRGDTQGVSRDEAMSSGMVPITNAVAAIPEFVDSTCGILAVEEDAQGLAKGIQQLYDSPELFQQLSENAANRVRRQSSREYTIDKELQLIKKRVL